MRKILNAIWDMGYEYGAGAMGFLLVVFGIAIIALTVLCAQQELELNKLKYELQKEETPGGDTELILQNTNFQIMKNLMLHR